MGNDPEFGYIGILWFISIHVPAWGTTDLLESPAIVSLFQSTFPRGERLNDWAQNVEINDFNPRSRVGNDGGVE